MPDIAMCRDKTCPDKHKCYRFLAAPSPRQSYFLGVVRDERTQTCEYFAHSQARDILKADSPVG